MVYTDIGVLAQGLRQNGESIVHVTVDCFNLFVNELQAKAKIGFEKAQNV